MKKIVERIKNKKAITLISLVVTIVILVILAAVAINMVIGNNGLFNKAKLAKQEYVNSSDKEKDDIDVLVNDIDSIAGTRNGNENKINYSTEEQAIGTWIDGKTLYQITLANKTINHGSNSYDVSSLSIDTFVNCFINTTQCNGSFSKRIFPDDEHEIYMNNSTTLTIESTPTSPFTGCNITIQYTKNV